MEAWLDSARRFGHSLEKLQASSRRTKEDGVPVHGEPLPPPVAHTPVQSASPSGEAAPIQRMPKWKKGLFGLEGLGGLGALGLGGASLLGLTAAVSSPLLAGGLLLGGGLAAYHSYKGLTRDDNKITQQAINQVRSTHQDLSTRAKKEELSSRESLLNDVLSEHVPYLDDERVTTTPVESGRSELAFPGIQSDDRQKRNYRIRLNTNEGNLPTHILHELTHISVDQKYRGNKKVGDPTNRDEPVNLHDTENMSETADRMDRQVAEMRKVVSQDKALGKSQRKHIDERLKYAQERPEVEYDTVMNELLYYLHLNKIGEDSAASKEIEKAARGAYQRRNEEL